MFTCVSVSSHTSFTACEHCPSSFLASVCSTWLSSSILSYNYNNTHFKHTLNSLKCKVLQTLRCLQSFIPGCGRLHAYCCHFQAAVMDDFACWTRKGLTCGCTNHFGTRHQWRSYWSSCSRQNLLIAQPWPLSGTAAPTFFLLWTFYHLSSLTHIIMPIKQQLPSLSYNCVSCSKWSSTMLTTVNTVAEWVSFLFAAVQFVH